VAVPRRTLPGDGILAVPTVPEIRESAIGALPRLSWRCHHRRVALRVLVVDDHPAFRRLACRLLAAGGYDVAGEASDGVGALAQAALLRPDVVLLDVMLPDLDGFAVAEQLATLPAHPIVVLVSGKTGTEIGRRLDTAPVRGFLTKDQLTLEAFAAMTG
jgi:CheY-like chemotaxis protein